MWVENGKNGKENIGEKKGVKKMQRCPYYSVYNKERSKKNFPCIQYVDSHDQLACRGVLDGSDGLYFCLFPPKREFIQDESEQLLEVSKLINKRGVPQGFPDLFKKYGSLTIAKFEIGYLLSLPLEHLKAVKERAKNKIKKENNTSIRDVLTLAGSRFVVNKTIEGLEEKIIQISDEVFGYTIQELLHPDKSYLETMNPAMYKELGIKDSVEKIRREKERALRYIKSEYPKKYKKMMGLQKRLNAAIEQDAFDEANEEEEFAFVRKVFETYLEKASQQEKQEKNTDLRRMVSGAGLSKLSGKLLDFY